MKQQAFDFINHLDTQRAFSEQTFGPGPRVAGVVKRACFLR